jgi:hypothetical protein
VTFADADFARPDAAWAWMMAAYFCPFGQDRRDQQFKRRREIELDTRIRVKPGQLTVDPACSPYQRGPRRGGLGHCPSLTLGRTLASNGAKSGKR